MGSEDGRGGRGSANDAFEGRDLLVGRPQGAEGRRVHVLILRG